MQCGQAEPREPNVTATGEDAVERCKALTVVRDDFGATGNHTKLKAGGSIS
jgi:hypothetical protein